MPSPGKSHRTGISLIQLTEMYPDEDSAVKWFESVRWPEGRCCPHCGSIKTSMVLNAKPMPYWCTDCRSYFSVRTGTVFQSSRLPMRKWLFAIYLYVTSLKGVSSMKLHRDIGVSQRTAWFMLHRIREAWTDLGLDELLEGIVEVDETYIGGKRKNMSNKKRKELKETGAGRGTVGKAAVVGAKERKSKKVRAKVIEKTDKETLQKFVTEAIEKGSHVCTDEHQGYKGIPYEHSAVCHSVSEYVNGQAHTNGIESFWALLKRGYHGIYHHMSKKHLQRYINEFAGRAEVRERDTAEQMRNVVSCAVGKHLMYRDLTG